MPADTFNYDDLADLRYNPFTRKYNPKIIGYDSSDPEERTIPSTSPFIIKLFESPLQAVPSKIKITLKATGEILKEVAKGTTPANKQYAVNYDELGNGQILFNAGQAGQVVYINYYSLGTIHQKSTLKFSIFGGSTTKIVASSDSSTGSQTIADEIILTTEDATTHLNNIIDALDSIGGGEIKILEGTYNASGQIVLKDSVVISGSGYNTKIFNAGFQGVLISGSAANNCTLRDFLIDNNNVPNSSGIAGNAWHTKCSKVKIINSGNLGFTNCYGLTQCSVNVALLGFSTCNYAQACDAQACTNGFSNSNRISSCEAYNNSNDGFSSCDNATGCYAYNNTDDGFVNCDNLSSCESFNNGGEGFNNCDRISACYSHGNTADGFQGCDNITSCYANTNANGFDNCKSMGHNYSIGNIGTNYSATCFADYGGTVAVSDDAAGGWNA